MIALVEPMATEAYCQAVTVNTGMGGERGTLVFIREQLVAVLVQIGANQDVEQKLHGKWFLEAGFGPCQDWNNGLVFASRDEAVAWVREQVLTDGPAANWGAS